MLKSAKVPPTIPPFTRLDSQRKSTQAMIVTLGNPNPILLLVGGVK